MELKDTCEGMLSSDYKERFIAEFEQTSIRKIKLDRMIKGYREGTLPFTPNCPLEVLASQSEVMGALIAILELRADIEDVDLTEAYRRLEEV